MQSCTHCNQPVESTVWWLGRIFCSMAHAEYWRENNPDATPQAVFNRQADHAGKWAAVAKATGHSID